MCSLKHTGILGGLALRVVEVGGHRHHHVLDGRAHVRLGDAVHVAQHHRRDLLGEEALRLRLVRHLDGRAVLRLTHHLEGPQLDVRLHRRLVVLAPDQPLGVKHSVLGISRGLVLRGSSDEPLRI